MGSLEGATLIGGRKKIEKKKKKEKNRKKKGENTPKIGNFPCDGGSGKRGSFPLYYARLDSTYLTFRPSLRNGVFFPENA